MAEIKNKKQYFRHIVKQFSKGYRFEFIIIIIGLILIHIIFLSGSYYGNIVNPVKAGQLGDFVGGYIGTLFALLSVVLLYSTLKNQRQSSAKEKIENKFFELLKIHRENVAELSIDKYTQRSIFIVLRAEFRYILEVVSTYYTFPDKKNEVKADISYLFLYYGLGETTSQLLLNVTKKHYCSQIIQNIYEELEKARNKPIGRLKYLKDYFDMDDRYQPFCGYQTKLGHYYRHLYQTVLFIESQEDLEDDVKILYLKILRAQLGTHEIAIFFYNSISSLGKKAWMENRYPHFNNKESDTNLIEKYQLIRNLPPEPFTYEIDSRSYYPKIDYEWESIIKSE